MDIQINMDIWVAIATLVCFTVAIVTAVYGFRG
jgi:hypothetical protein